MSRLNKVIKNTTFSYTNQLISSALSFVTRTIFIRQLGATYLGINGLFSNILGLLALAELGFGTAMNFEMYKPIADKDYNKVNTLLNLYKKVYHCIGIFIFTIGLLLIPALKYLVKDPGNIGNIYLYYILYLINVSISYYSSYLFCVTNAEQKVYINSFISLIFSIFVNLFHIIVLLTFKSFLLYLIVSTLFAIIQQIAIRIYFNLNYNHIFKAKPTKLDIETKDHLKKNLSGLIVSKLSDVLTHQTDNIIISAGINIITVGFADNYIIITNFLKKIILNLMTVVVPSMGNLIATESKEKCYKVFLVYDIFDYVIYSFFTICLITLYQPFISLWAGQDKLIDNWSMIMLCLSFYLSGRNHAFMNFKTAAGIFYDIKITCIVSVLINLIISVIGVMKIGLVGVYIGTCISLLYANIRNLRLSYNYLTGQSVINYYVKRFFQFIFTIFPIVLLYKISGYFAPGLNWINFFRFFIIVIVLSISWVFLINYNSKEFKDLLSIMKTSIYKIVTYRSKR